MPSALPGLNPMAYSGMQPFSSTLPLGASGVYIYTPPQIPAQTSSAPMTASSGVSKSNSQSTKKGKEKEGGANLKTESQTSSNTSKQNAPGTKSAPPPKPQRNPATVAHFSTLTVHGVLQWLKSLPVPPEATEMLILAFEKNKITGNVMVGLSEKDLEEDMGIDKLGPRRLFSIHLETTLCQ